MKTFIPPLLISTATRDESLCVIANPAFVVYSSIVSFYVPFIITLLVYVQIYVVLRKRRKRVNTKPKQRVCQAADPDVATSLKVSRSCIKLGLVLKWHTWQNEEEIEVHLSSFSFCSFWIYLNEVYINMGASVMKDEACKAMKVTYLSVKLYFLSAEISPNFI